MNNLSRRSDASGASYQAALAAHCDAVWTDLGRIVLGEAAKAWIQSLSNEHTRTSYVSGLRALEARRLFRAETTLQQFALANHDATLDRIKAVPGWSESSRQARAALFCSFTRFLARRTGGIVRKANPSREGAHKTFYRVRDQVRTRALTEDQCRSFLRELGKLNRRDALIAMLMLQGGKRRSEVLALTADQIDWDRGRITFRLLKTQGKAKAVIVTYLRHVMQALRAYLGGRRGPVFVTAKGRPVRPTQIVRTFRCAGQAAGIPSRFIRTCCGQPGSRSTSGTARRIPTS